MDIAAKALVQVFSPRSVYFVSLIYSTWVVDRQPGAFGFR